MMRIQQDRKRIAHDAFPFFIGFRDLVSRQNHPDASDMRRVPIGVGHLCPIRFQPIQVFDFPAVNWATLEKMAPPKNGLGPAQLNQLPGKFEQIPLLSRQIPIEPSHRRILAVHVVVSMLSLTELVASQQHRHSL